MKIKKALAAVMALCVAVDSFSVYEKRVPEFTITANAEESFTSGIYEKLDYKKYSGHIEISGCDMPAGGDIVIPADINGLPVTAIGTKYPLTEQGKINADVYGGGDGITANDALSIQKYDAKVIDKLPE